MITSYFLVIGTQIHYLAGNFQRGETFSNFKVFNLTSILI